MIFPYGEISPWYYEANGTKVYVDGELASSDTYQIDISQLLTEEANTWIGHGNWGAGEGFLGMLDDFRIYGRALNDEEIAKIAKSKEIMSSDSNRLLMETDFSQNGVKVLSAAVRETVSVKTKVTNYSKTRRMLAYYMTGYGTDGTVTEQMQQIGGEAKAESMKTTVFSKDIMAKAGTAYYQLQVKDVTDISCTQEFTAGYLPVGDALTAQMIAGTYQGVEGIQMIVSVSDVEGTKVTVNGKTFTAVLEDSMVKLTDSQGVYAVKHNASATGGVFSTEVTAEPRIIDRSVGGNPITGTDKDGKRMYCGDPAAVVIDDKVYLVVSHDNGIPGNNNGNYYNIPDWQYYTSTDLKTWTHEGLFMKQADIPWRTTSNDAWASQMIPYTNKATGETKYYFYFCTPSERRTHAIGVAVADEPGGPYTAVSKPLVKGADTWVEGIGNAGHHDIDPTVWVDTDEEGNEHRYLMWGNTTCYVAELNEDMVSIKDRNGDGKITIDHTGSGSHDIKYINFANIQPNQGFTEAPWLYRRQDENGKYYGKYYMFAAWGWAEKMGYATADDPFGPWTFEGMIMENTLTSNTNHPSVIDFKGKTYFIYHNGALPGGNGGNRSICIQEMAFHEDGSIEMMPDLSLGVGGSASVIRTSENKYLGHDPLGNTQDRVTKYGEQIDGIEGTDQKEAKRVSSLIQAIGQVSNTAECKNKIIEARNAYNALTPSQKTLVAPEVLKKLTDAEQEYDRQREAEAKAKQEYGRQKEAEEKKKAQAGTISLSDFQKAITATNTDKKDVKGSNFRTLKAKAIGGDKSVTVSWNKSQLALSNCANFQYKFCMPPFDTRIL